MIEHEFADLHITAITTSLKHYKKLLQLPLKTIYITDSNQYQ